MRARWVRALMLGVLVAAGVSPLRAQVADGGTACTPSLGVPNTWDQISDPVLVNSYSNANSADLTPDALRSSIDPERPCLMYRVVGDTRAVQRSTDGGKTFKQVYLDTRVASGKAAVITGVYTPAADVVYLAEGGNGTAVVKSDDAGATWQPANGGIEGLSIGRMAMTSDPDVAYAVAEIENSEEGPATILDIYVTRNGGRSWDRLLDSQIVRPRPGRQAYSITVDPADPGHVMIAIQGVAAAVGGTPEAGSPLLEVEDYGETVTPVRVAADIAEVVFARREGGALRLYAMANGANQAANGVMYSDDAASHWAGPWKLVDAGISARWYGGIVDPVTPDKMLYFGKPTGGANALLALYTRTGFADEDIEVGEQPDFKHQSYAITQYRADRFGQFYIDVGVDCQFYACPPGVDPRASYRFAWYTVRFRPPDPGQAVKLRTGRQADPARGGTFASVPSARCTIEPQAPLHSADRVDDAGSLAFDGTRFYYTRRAEQGPDPWSAVIRVADPTTCKETGRIVVHFEPAVYQDARKRAISDADGSQLLPERPSIDSLAYDALHDELWFSVTRTSSYVPPYNGDADGAPFPMWAVKRGGAGVDRQAELRYWANPCGPGGLGLMAHDRVRDTLWTCYRKVPGERARTGKPFVTCLHPMFKGEVADDEVWKIRAWGVGRPGVLIAVKDHGESLPPRRVVQYDARTCTHTDEWSLPPTDNVPEPDQGPTYVSSQLVCDPVTFRDRLGGSAAPAAVAWLREGKVFTPYRVDPFEGPGLTCPWPTVLSYSGAAGVDPGARLDACVTLAVPGAGGGIPGATVRISVADGPAVNAVTDKQGRACVPYNVSGQAVQGSRVNVKGWLVEDAHLLASAAEGSVLVGNLPLPAPPAPVILLPETPAPPPVPLLPAPAPASAPQPGVQPAMSPPGQAAAQQGFASEKEKEVQLAHASQASNEEEAPEEEYAFSLALAASMVLGAMALGRMLGGNTSPSPNTVMAYETSAAAQGRRRRRR